MARTKELLKTFPHLKESAARLASQLMAGNMPPDEDLPEETQSWIRQCYNRPSWPEITLDALNYILDGFGTAIVETKSWVGNYYGNIRACYVNMGDTYATTIFYDNAKNKFSITSLGNYVRRIGA